MANSFNMSSKVMHMNYREFHHGLTPFHIESDGFIKKVYFATELGINVKLAKYISSDKTDKLDNLVVEGVVLIVRTIKNYK